MNSNPQRAPAFRPLSRFFALVLSAALAVSLSACETGGKEISEEDRSAITALLEGYLPKMAEAYRSGNIEVVREFAVEKEMATLYKQISDLMSEHERVLDSELKSLEIDEISIWNHSNAFVTTREIWDIQLRASGSNILLSEILGQRDRVKYQLKRTEDGWRVIYREREPQAAGDRQPTGAAEGEGPAAKSGERSAVDTGSQP